MIGVTGVTGQKKRIKNLYKGIFNYASEISVMRTYAYSEEQARVIFCNRLAKKHEVHVSHVLAKFDKRPNYEISKEIEWTET